MSSFWILISYSVPNIWIYPAEIEKSISNKSESKIAFVHCVNKEKVQPSATFLKTIFFPWVWGKNQYLQASFQDG